MTVYRSRHHGPLGTVVELHLETESETIALQAEALVLSEIDRLEDVFSVYRSTSALSRWIRGEIAPVSELADLLAESLVWQEITDGAYNPAVGIISMLWEQGGREGVLPDRLELDRLARLIASPGYLVGPDGIGLRRSRVGMSFNALAKGWIADRATRVAVGLRGVDGAVISAGGDILNLGSQELRVGIEDPLQTYDNVPPIAEVGVEPGCALATSGGARRGWMIGDTWFSHVIDPRTGIPAGHIASATVLAPNAATADVMATALTVLAPEEGVELAEAFCGVSCHLISADGERRQSSNWPGD